MISEPLGGPVSPWIRPWARNGDRVTSSVSQRPAPCSFGLLPSRQTEQRALQSDTHDGSSRRQSGTSLLAGPAGPSGHDVRWAKRPVWLVPGVYPPVSIISPGVSLLRDVGRESLYGDGSHLALLLLHFQLLFLTGNICVAVEVVRVYFLPL